MDKDLTNSSLEMQDLDSNPYEIKHVGSGSGFPNLSVMDKKSIFKNSNKILYICLQSNTGLFSRLLCIICNILQNKNFVEKFQNDLITYSYIPDCLVEGLFLKSDLASLGKILLAELLLPHPAPVHLQGHVRPHPNGWGV